MAQFSDARTTAAAIALLDALLTGALKPPGLFQKALGWRSLSITGSQVRGGFFLCRCAGFRV